VVREIGELAEAGRVERLVEEELDVAIVRSGPVVSRPGAIVVRREPIVSRPGAIVVRREPIVSRGGAARA
jgi:hypothetical protein